MGMTAYTRLHVAIDLTDKHHLKEVQTILLNEWLKALSSEEYVGYDYSKEGTVYSYGRDGKYSCLGVFFDLLTKLLPEFYHWKDGRLNDDTEEKDIFEEWIRFMDIYDIFFDLQFCDDAKYSSSISKLKELI